jgi:hypothetical protein
MIGTQKEKIALPKKFITRPAHYVHDICYSKTELLHIANHFMNGEAIFGNAETVAFHYN